LKNKKERRKLKNKKIQSEDIRHIEVEQKKIEKQQSLNERIVVELGVNQTWQCTCGVCF